MRPQLGRFRKQTEYVVWGSKGNMPLQCLAQDLSGVIREPVRKAAKLHMTGKPTPLMRQLGRICEEDGKISRSIRRLRHYAGGGAAAELPLGVRRNDRPAHPGSAR